MKIEILIVGNLHNKSYKTLSELYIERISHYNKISIRVVKEEKIRKLSEKEVIGLEGKRLLHNLSSTDYVVALDKSGKSYGSKEFAKFLQTTRNQSRKKVIFAIGGPLGLSEPVLSRADKQISLSKMTFAHELSCVILLEQIYRGFNFLSGGKYHK